MDDPLLKIKLDELADLWRQAEAQLLELRPVVPIEYDIPKSKNKDVIGFRRVGQTWRICVLYDDEWRPVIDCPVHDRIEFVEHYPALRKKVIAVSEKTLARVQAATAKLRAALEKLNGSVEAREARTKRAGASKAAPLGGRVLRRKGRM